MKNLMILIGVMTFSLAAADERISLNKKGDLEEVDFEKARRNAVGEEMDELQIHSGKVYKSVTIRGFDNVGIKIMHAGGTARISLGDLSETLQRRFGYDPQKAEKQKNTEQTREYERLVQLEQDLRRKAALKAELKDRDKRSSRSRSAGGRRAHSLSDADQRKVNEYKVRIAKIQRGIEGAQQEIGDYTAKAADMRGRAQRTVVVGRREDGSVIYGERADRAKMKRAATYERQARKLEETIEEAGKVISSLDQKIGHVYEQAESK
jgi:hypothetical protein